PHASSPVDAGSQEMTQIVPSSTTSVLANNSLVPLQQPVAQTDQAELPLMHEPQQPDPPKVYFLANGFKNAPKMDSLAFCRDCIDKLRQKRRVVIFPEGGSHDQPTMLALKPGVSIMTLQASAQLGKAVP
ncbi:unnamed protein product, partial [Amoebophrya sp. A25]